MHWQIIYWSNSIYNKVGTNFKHTTDIFFSSLVLNKIFVEFLIENDMFFQNYWVEVTIDVN